MGLLRISMASARAPLVARLSLRGYRPAAPFPAAESTATAVAPWPPLNAATGPFLMADCRADSLSLTAVRPAAFDDTLMTRMCRVASCGGSVCSKVVLRGGRCSKLRV